VLEGQPEGPTDESSPYPAESDDPYFQSKVDAERGVYRFLKEHPHVRIVLILPTAMLGPSDPGPTPTGAFVRNLLQGKVRFLLPGAHRVADARDVAWAVVAAIEGGESGERYLVGGRKYPMAEFYETLTAVTGKPTPRKQISPGKLLLAARAMALASKVTRRPPPIRPNVVKRLQAEFWYSSAKAEEALGVHFRPLSETLHDTAKWFESENLA
jgi:nucleoside-diphosphate-sugar epimerase